MPADVPLHYSDLCSREKLLDTIARGQGNRDAKAPVLPKHPSFVLGLPGSHGQHGSFPYIRKGRSNFLYNVHCCRVRMYYMAWSIC